MGFPQLTLVSFVRSLSILISRRRYLRQLSGMRPELATVRRFWVDEPDKSGYLIHKQPKWIFSYAPGEADDESLSHLENHPVRLGDYITITETDGEVRPFRVVKLHKLTGLGCNDARWRRA